MMRYHQVETTQLEDALHLSLKGMKMANDEGGRQL